MIPDTQSVRLPLDEKGADILLVTGTVNHRNKKVLVNLFDQMPHPRLVIAIGSCALSGGIFREAYNVVGGVNKVIPVDVYIPGCPAKPEAIIDGVILGLKKFNRKRGAEISRESRSDLRQL